MELALEMNTGEVCQVAKGAHRKMKQCKEGLEVEKRNVGGREARSDRVKSQKKKGTQE